MQAVVVIGNPKRASRTRDAAEIVANLLGATNVEVIEVADLGPGLLSWGDAAVATAKQTVKDADIAIIASPTYKATYSGLLKLFLDQFEGRTGLAGVTAIPLMLGAGEAHALAPDLLLKPVLVELGATCPAGGLFLLEQDYADSPRLHTWIEQWGDVIKASAGNRR